jgi:hypothetical protein
MQLQADGVRLAIASPMASAASEARSDHPASAMPVIEACGKHVLCTGDAQALCVIASPVPFAEAVIARPRFRPHGRGRPHGIAFASRVGGAGGDRVGEGRRWLDPYEYSSEEDVFPSSGQWVDAGPGGDRSLARLFCFPKAGGSGRAWRSLPRQATLSPIGESDRRAVARLWSRACHRARCPGSGGGVTGRVGRAARGRWWR